MDLHSWTTGTFPSSDESLPSVFSTICLVFQRHMCSCFLLLINASKTPQNSPIADTSPYCGGVACAGPKFKGIKMVPSGLHVMYWTSGPNGLMQCMWFLSAPGRVVVSAFCMFFVHLYALSSFTVPWSLCMCVCMRESLCVCVCV